MKQGLVLSRGNHEFLIERPEQGDGCEYQKGVDDMFVQSHRIAKRISDLCQFFAKATPLNLTLILKILDPDVKYEVTCAAGDIAT